MALAGEFSDLVKVYIENLNLPLETKVKLIASNPKTLADVSLWLEEHKDIKTEEKPSSNPFAPAAKINTANEIQLFASNPNIVHSTSDFVFNKGELVDTDDASWGLSIDRTKNITETGGITYYSNTTQAAEAQPKTDTTSELTPEEELKEAQDNAIASIEENADSALETVRQQEESQGVISKAYSSIKEYFDSEMSTSNVCRNIYAEYKSAELLKRAQQGDLTLAEYFGGKIDMAITLLTGNRELSAEDRNLLKERLSNYTPEQLNELIDKIKYCDNETYAKLNDSVDKLIEEEKTKNYIKNLPDSNSFTIKSIVTNSSNIGDDRLLTFEEVWEMERGVKFDPQAIQEYEESMAQYALATMAANKANNLHELLDKSMVIVKGNDENCVNSLVKETGERQLEINLITALKSLYGNNEEKINQKLQEISGGNIGFKNGLTVYNEFSKNQKSYCLLTSAQKLLEGVDKNVNDILGGHDVQYYQDKMTSSYQMAYGAKNATQLARAFVDDQEEIVGKVRTGVEVVGAGIMVAGMFICPPVAFAGALTSSFGGIGVEALNESTRSDGLSEEAKKKLTEELIQNAALFAVGGAAGKMGSAAKAALIAKKCPALMASISDIGIDATISLIGDMAITGEIDIKGEGLSQIMSLLAGHIRAGKFRRHNVSDNKSANYNQNNEIHSANKNNIPDNSSNKPIDTKQMAQKLNCDENEAKEIADIIESKPEIKDKLLKLIESGRKSFEIKELAAMATSDNIDDLTRLAKNESLSINYDVNGNLVSNQFEDVLNILKANPQYKNQILDIASSKNRPASDINRISEYIQKYPEYAEDILTLVKSNRNIKVGHSLNPKAPSHIDGFINLLKQYPDHAEEIKQYANVQRRADQDTSNPLPEIKRFAEMIAQNPDKKDLYTQLSKNPNLDASTIKLLTDKSNDQQYIKDLTFLSSKNYSESGINYNMRLMQKYPEMREIIMSEPPKFDFIDNDITNTSQSTLQKRFDTRDKIKKIAPKELKTLQQTLGDNYFHKIKWEEIIPENATPEQIKSILTDLNSSSKFFSRIASNEEQYGKNIQWAHEMDVISKSASVLIKNGASYDEVMDHIARMYNNYDISKTLDSNYNPDPRRVNSGKSRAYEPDSEFADATGFSYLTPFDKNGNYTEYYDRFMKLAGKKRKSPYPDVELTQISLQAGYGYVMGHPRNSSVDATLKHVQQRYEELSPLLQKVKSGTPLSAKEKEIAHEKIAEMYFLMANAMPYSRGSNGITDIFMRSMYKELGIEMPAIKHGVSLDLEAFCMDLDDYKKKWKTFFEK